MQNHLVQHKQARAAMQQRPNTLRFIRPILRPIGRLLIAAQLAVCLQPLSALAQDNPAAAQMANPLVKAQIQRSLDWQAQTEMRRQTKKAEEARAARKADEVATDNLKELEETVRSLQAQHLLLPEYSKNTANSQDNTAHAAPESIAIQSSLSNSFKRLLAAQTADQAAVRADFAKTRAHLIASKLEATSKAEMLRRHDAAVAAFEAHIGQFNQAAQNAMGTDGAIGQNQLAALTAFFDKHPTAKRSLAPKVPAIRNNLPWKTPEATQRTPAESQAAWADTFAEQPGLQARQTFSLAQPSTSRSAIGGLQFDTPPSPDSAPTTADLAETAETAQTPDIQAKAQELGNNPVAIHNYIRNNFDWVPTWGAIQSSQDTWDKKRGNAFDLASVEIAMLRAAGIPARYQFGTIELPADKAMNWVGGATKAEAVQQILGQGGIANIAQASGGQIATIKMEHVWVQVYANWAPSRGAKQGSSTQHPNPNPALNAWVPLDPSYKQYQYQAGMDLKNQVPLDAQSILDAAKQGATINEAQGWVQNLNQAAVQARLQDYQARLKTYIEQENANATVGDVIGKKIIPQHIESLLAGSLPYKTVALGQQTAQIPANLQHQFTYKLYASSQDQSLDSPILSFTAKTSELVGKRLTLTYAPASQKDADTIASYLPKPHADGSPIKPEELPKSLPGYLINLIPQINLDGQVVAKGTQSITMGTELGSQGGFTNLDFSGWDITAEESNVAGQATAIGISAGGISAPQLQRLKDRLEASKTQLQALQQNPNGAVPAGLSGEQISGDMLSATIWSWFAAGESQNRLSQNQSGIIENPGLSYGLFHASVQPVYSWGVVRQVKFPGVNMDAGHVRNLTWAQDNDSKKWVAYNKMRGQYMSALEGAIPERIFNDTSKCNIVGSPQQTQGLPNCNQGISAIKALQVAASQGQKIYTITQAVYASNPNIVNSALSAHSATTKQAISNALNAGLEVTIHERPITIDGWTGAGYTKIDPNTGAGGYMIDGGGSGGILIGYVFVIAIVVLAAVGIAGAVIAIATGGWIIGLLSLIWQLLNFASFIKSISESKNPGDISREGFKAIIGALAPKMPLLDIRATSYGFMLSALAFSDAIFGIIDLLY